ncbi:hypothetical protein GCM10023328_24020 [Modestobacter marinus]|uniref:GH16 domain-containing protein n=1 Tax=Modestobacter marinus TaxID=477641 RepID=A0ABQ2FX97_9ACTN|nr:hypothetical protein GCM10011589_18860 [Modestobacter marinus]
MSRTKLLVVLFVLLTLVAGSTAFLLARAADVQVSASSSAAGSEPAALLDHDKLDAAVPLSDRPVSWRSDDETTGAWVELDWPEPTTVDHVEVRAAGRAPFKNAVLTFDRGGSLLLTADEDGNVGLDFPARQVSSARLTFAEVPQEATSVALTSLVLDGSGDPRATDGEATDSAEVTISSGADPGALVDGDIGSGEVGGEWEALPDDLAPWGELSWEGARELSSVQIVGPSARAFDPTSSASAALHGRLVFDDGSSVLVSGISSGEPQVTTIAFTPRMASSVRLVLEKTIDQAEFAIREIAVHEAGTTPPVWPQQEQGHVVAAPEADDCGTAAAPPSAGGPDGQLALVCPAPGAAIDGETSVVLHAPAGTAVTATAWRPATPGSRSGSIEPIASGTADAAGRLPLTFDASSLQHGPFAVRMTAEVQGDVRPLYVQLVNRGGEQVTSEGSSPPGMTLQWAEDFSTPLSATQTGAGARYAATKPAPWGPSEFGDAVFADPADGSENLATLDGHLRVRVDPIGNRDIRTPYDQQHVGGILSSARVGGSGFAAQYGYFEARMLGPAGLGTWPAFWMLDSESATNRGEVTSEVDAVELYGRNTASSCHAIHAWTDGEDALDEQFCLEDGIRGDWALSWHTYGVRIMPGEAVFTVDGREVHRMVGVVNDAHPYFWMVDLALGGGWPVDLSSTTGVADLYVDWVRVWT